MQELFSNKSNFQVVRLSSIDAEKYTDHMHIFRKLVLECEEAYPNIKKWVDRKVIPGVKSLERIAYLGYLDGKPAVSAVVKRGAFTKFCHLKIDDEIQDVHLGETFFALMALEARAVAKKVHFTLPESLWAQKNGFFQSFGFENAVRAGHQYRLFDDELACSASFDQVWQSTLSKLPKIARMISLDGSSFENKILLSIGAEHAKKIFEGTKKIEIRRKFSSKWIGQRVCLYATKPIQSLVGEALIKNVSADTPQMIWEKYHDQIGCTKKQFDEYTKNSNQVYAISLEEAIPYMKQISLHELYLLTKKRLAPPQSYCTLDNNQKWSEAVSMSSLLQNSFGQMHLAL